MADLPRDWSRHQSASNPGHEYYFNNRTGAKTWDIEEVLSYEKAKQAKKRPSSDYSISDLEKMLEEKKEEERKRKLAETKPSSRQERGKKEEVPAKRLKVPSKAPNSSTPVPEVKKSDNSRVTRSSSRRKPEPEVTKSLKTTSSSISKPKDSTPKKTSTNKGNHKEKISNKEEKDVYEVIGCSPINKKLKGYKIPIKLLPPSASSTKKDCLSEDGTKQSLQNIKLCLKKVRTPPSPLPQPSGGAQPSQSQSSSSQGVRDRPPTPTLVRDLQEEEEVMEWETVDMEGIIKETQKAREIVCQAMDIEEDSSASEEAEKPQEAAPTSPCSSVIAVIDTNVFISSLGLVTTLLESEKVVVVLPWMVVQELDSLKTSGSDQTGVRARAAVRLINNLLLSRPANLVTQTARESRAVAARYDSRSPDDRILATCLESQEAGHQVFLVSNDVNLCNKALINGVKCGKSENILDVISKNKNLPRESEDVAVDIYPKNFVTDMMKEVREVTRDLLEEVVIEEFQEAYDEKLWRAVISIKPQSSKPFWSLRDLFTIFSKHHIAVFGLSFPQNGNELKSRLLSVRQKLSGVNSGRIQDAEVAITEVLRLLDRIGDKENYRGLVSRSRDRIMEQHRQIEGMKSKASQSSQKKILDCSSSSSMETRQGKVEKILTTVWEIIIAFTRAFAEVRQVPHNLPAIERQIHLQPQPRLDEELSTFYKAVDGVHNSMLSVVGGNNLVILIFSSVFQVYHCRPSD